jgi:ankyrin repeat protein
MTSQQLPERPNLEQLKNQAKTLLRAAQAGQTQALLRFRALPAFAGKTAAELGALALALHDAQSVIAREHGFASWNELREHVEALSLSFAAAVDEFVRCATGDARGRAQRLLALHPGIAHANLHAELVLGDAEAVEARLRDRPELATLRGGTQDWEPLLYVCHTCLHKDAAARASGLVAIARRLLALGANPNAVYVWRWHAELPRTTLWAALCAVAHLPLAELLLESGANPTDGVSLHITAGSGNLPALELLRKHAVDVNGIAGGVPPLAYILGWAKDSAGARWLLEHGADANLPWAESGEAPLHVAARRWDVPMVEMLADHGADLSARRTDGCSAHTIAALQGNHAVATWLLEHGAKDELSPLERFVAACARGDRAGAESMLRTRPSLSAELLPGQHLMLHRPAESGDVAVLETMLACGFDAHAKDKDGVTALHRAAMAGHTQAVRVLLRFEAPVDALDDMFDATPLVWAVEGWRNPKSHSADHPGVARLLIAAGSPVGWTPPQSAPSPEGTLEMLAELVAAASRPA